jgi:PilZ domain-containing protein
MQLTGYMPEAMRIARTNFDREESRRDRRYALPSLLVEIGGKEYVSDNWSLGGFLLSGKLPFAIGSVVSGTLYVDSSGGAVFAAKVARKDEKTGTTGFHFRDMAAEVMSKLDRALARRLVSRRRP